MAGAAALPRDNGELVFDAPWQGRVLGMAVGVVEPLGLAWDAFRRGSSPPSPTTRTGRTTSRGSRRSNRSSRSKG